MNGIILPIRSSASAKKYAAIWLPKLGSPLMHYSRLQAKDLALRFSNQGHEVVVDLAMRYGKPSTADVLGELRTLGVERLLLFPLYPQYSATTSASSFDEVFRVLRGWRNQPELRLIKHYHDHPAYIKALKDQVLSTWEKEGRPDFNAGARLVMSFHGLPKRNLIKGDPYHCECLKSGRLLGEALGLEDDQYLVTFQSRFGKAEWLKPYTATTIKILGQQQCPRVDVFCPGFPADCLETLEEIAIEGRAIYLEMAGKIFGTSHALIATLFGWMRCTRLHGNIYRGGPYILKPILNWLCETKELKPLNLKQNKGCKTLEIWIFTPITRVGKPIIDRKVMKQS